MKRQGENVQRTRQTAELQVFPVSTPEILPESREKQATRDGSGPIRNPQPDPLSAPESGERPGNWPAGAHTPGPWRLVHRYDVPEIVDQRGFEIVETPTLAISPEWLEANPDKHWGGHDESHIERDLEEDVANAHLIHAAPQLLDSLLAVEWGGAFENDDADLIECCPNCLAPASASDNTAGIHYAACELRDSLDAALGVTSPRISLPEETPR